MLAAPWESFAKSVGQAKLAAFLTILLVLAGLRTPLAAQDASPSGSDNSPCAERAPAQATSSASASALASDAASPNPRPQPGQTAQAVAPAASPASSAAPTDCPEP